MQRHVVIPGNDDLRIRDPGEKIAGGEIFPPSRALGQVTGDGHQSGIDLPDETLQRGQNRGINAAEMQIGEVDERPYRGLTSRHYFTIAW